MGVYSRSRYTFDLVLVYDSLSCSLEDVSNEAALRYNICRFFSCLWIVFFGGEVGDFGEYAAWLELANFKGASL